MNDLVDKVGSLLQSTNLASQQPMMSGSSKAMLAKVRKLVPPMLEKFHKGGHALARDRVRLANRQQGNWAESLSLVVAKSMLRPRASRLPLGTQGLIFHLQLYWRPLLLSDGFGPPW
jgi:hypothetical protein